MVSLGQFRSLVRQLLHLHESPHRTALAFAIGVFIAFSPTYGFHTLSAVFCAWAFRLNFIALLTGSLINNPWTVLPILGATFWTGFRLLGIPQGVSVASPQLDLPTLYGLVLPYALPFFVGGFVLSLFTAALSYPAAYFFILQYRRYRASEKKPGQPSRQASRTPQP